MMALFLIAAPMLLLASLAGYGAAFACLFGGQRSPDFSNPLSRVFFC